MNSNETKAILYVQRKEESWIQKFDEAKFLSKS